MHAMSQGFHLHMFQSRAIVDEIVALSTTGSSSSMHIIHNARLVTHEACFNGTLVFDEGGIVDLNQGNTGLAEAEDWGGDYLLPGLIEMNGTGVLFDRANHAAMDSLCASDLRYAGHGVTTCLHKVAPIAFGLDAACSGLTWMDRLSQADVLRCEHMLHLALGIDDQDLQIDPNLWLHDQRVRLISCPLPLASGVASHASLIRDLRGMLNQRTLPLPLAGTVVQDQNAIQMASEQAMSIVFDLPASLIQNAIDNGLVPACSDPFTPPLANEFLLNAHNDTSSLLEQVWALSDAGTSLPAAVAGASRHAAHALGLLDRGELAPELRADFIRVRCVEGRPIVLETWRQGRRVA